MGTYSVVTQEAFEELQVEAGVLLNSFNPASPATPSTSNIITATTGGIKASCIPQYDDWGSDVDNCPPNMKELKHLKGWDCKMSTNAIGTSLDVIKLALGAATKDTTNNKVTPKAGLDQSDFSSSLWWVGDRADGGLVAIELKNALSTGGFALTTSKNGKGQIALELTGHVSLAAQTTVPMVFYVIEGTSGTTGATGTT